MVLCPAGFEAGSMNITCTMDGEWDEPTESCSMFLYIKIIDLFLTKSFHSNINLVALMCLDQEVSGLNWPSTPAGTAAELQCSQKYPGKFGTITRECTLEGTWSEVQESCYDGAPGTWQYASSTIDVPRRVEITPVSPANVVGIETFEAVDPLPFGLRLDATTGSIAGSPYQVLPSKTYRIAGRNSQGESIAQITIVVRDNTCPADGVWHAAFHGQTLSTKCPFLGKEERSCVLNSLNEVEWSKVDSQCTMMILIVVAVAVVVVLVVVLVLFIVLRG